MEGGNPLSPEDRIMQAVAGFPRPDGLDPPGNHGGDEDVWIPSLEYLYEQAENKFPGLMARLLDDLEQNVDKNNLEYDSDIGVHGTNDENDTVTHKDRIGGSNSSKGKANETAPKARRSLLKDFTDSKDLRSIMRYVNQLPKKNYTQRVSSVFRHYFKRDKLTTSAQSGSDANENSDSSEFGYIRLASENSDKSIEGKPGPDLNSTESLLKKKHALQLALLFNELAGTDFSEYFRDGVKLDAIDVLVDDAHSEGEVVGLFKSTREFFNTLFRFMKVLKTGLIVTAENNMSLPTRGMGDLVVKVSGENVSPGECKNVSEFPAIIDFKRPNAGFWIGWTLLTGQEWTSDERNAFFKLKASEEEFQFYKVSWPELTDLVNLVGSKRVDVKYSESTAEAAPEEPAATSAAAPAPRLTASYFIRDGDQARDITRGLTNAKVKICVDNTRKTLGQVTHYATGNNCDIIGIADGMTFIAGSLNKLVREPKGDSNPDDSDQVLSAIFNSTAMIQTHNRDSTLHVLNFLCNSAMTSRVRCSWYSFLLVAGEVYGDDGDITSEKQAALRKSLKDHGAMRFDARYHCEPIPGIRESGKLQSRAQRAAIAQNLADTSLPGVPLCVTSSYFAIREWFRETVHEGYEYAGSSTPLVPGRSKSVAKVQLRFDIDRKNYVLKEYFGDKYSIFRWKLELDAYSRTDKLGPNDKKHVTKLVAFGSLDLDGPNPRLFLLLEYVEEPEDAPTEEATLVRELRKVHDLLESVGVYHNDLEDRNYKWQRDTDGSWYIKVFDFDHSRIHEPVTP